MPTNDLTTACQQAADEINASLVDTGICVACSDPRAWTVSVECPNHMSARLVIGAVLKATGRRRNQKPKEPT